MSGSRPNEPTPSWPDPTDVDLSSSQSAARRLWTPWRMKYVGGGGSEEGCVFCNRLMGADDVASLILHRGPRAFVIMNLYPYNTGHLMIVPNDHIASPENADPATLVEMANLLPHVTRALRGVLNPAGFNIGMNVGEVAGAGVAEHLHEHLVPRWSGDANFMPILASTMVIPEMLPVTYAKVRAELQRDLTVVAGSEMPAVTIVTLSEDASHVLLRHEDQALSLPRSAPAEGTPVWRGAAKTLAGFGVLAELTGWPGASRCDEERPPALLFEVAGTPTSMDSTVIWQPIDQAMQSVRTDVDRRLIASAVARHALPVQSPPGAEK